MLVHSVYFYLKEGVSDGEKADFRQSVAALGNIETVHALYLGSPAATPDRPVIEKGYALALTVLFRTIEDHNVYQEHTNHLKFIQENRNLWKKVVVYDAD